MPKMPKLPKMPKIEARLRRINFIKRKSKVCYYIYLLISRFGMRKIPGFYKKTERSDATILGILGTFPFRHFIIWKISNISSKAFCLWPKNH